MKLISLLSYLMHVQFPILAIQYIFIDSDPSTFLRDAAFCLKICISDCGLISAAAGNYVQNPTLGLGSGYGYSVKIPKQRGRWSLKVKRLKVALTRVNNRDFCNETWKHVGSYYRSFSMYDWSVSGCLELQQTKKRYLYSDLKPPSPGFMWLYFKSLAAGVHLWSFAVSHGHVAISSIFC